MLLSSSTVLARASAAAIHAAVEVALIAQAQAADGFLPAFGMANAVPPAIAIGARSKSFIGTASSETSSLVVGQHVRHTTAPRSAPRPDP